MYYQLSRLGLCVVKSKGHFQQFSGSSKFRCRENNIILKSWGENQNPQKLERLQQRESIVTKEKTRKYRLKKTKIRNKILNFFSLNASKKFCAFYSISFPHNISDEIGYRLLNTWLTRCRKECGLKSYLWVAERQKNGTLHFHLITNNYMNIRKVNNFMKEAIYTQWSKSEISTTEKNIKKYNGVDVDNLYYSKRAKNRKKRLPKIEAQRKLSYYLTKYISKNNTLSDRLPWHCSRDISALFTKINYYNADDCEIIDLVADNPDAVATYKADYFTMHFFMFIPDEHHFNDLVEANNLIYEKINQT